MSRTEISKIILKIADREIELSLEEARELKRILNDLPPSDKTVYAPPVVIGQDRWILPYPADDPFPYRRWTSDGTSDGTSVSLICSQTNRNI